MRAGQSWRTSLVVSAGAGPPPSICNKTSSPVCWGVDTLAGAGGPGAGPGDDVTQRVEPAAGLALLAGAGAAGGAVLPVAPAVPLSEAPAPGPGASFTRPLAPASWPGGCLTPSCSLCWIRNIILLSLGGLISRDIEAASRLERRRRRRRGGETITASSRLATVTSSQAALWTFCLQTSYFTQQKQIAEIITFVYISNDINLSQVPIKSSAQTKIWPALNLDTKFLRKADSGSNTVG